MKLALRIAFRHLGFKHQGSFTSFASIVALIGLGLGVCALVLTSAVLNGFEKVISQKIAGFDGHIRVQHYLYKPVAPFKMQLDSILTANSSSFTTTAFVQEMAMARKGKKAEGILITGHGEKSLPENIKLFMRKGSAQLIKGGAVIGMELADALHVGVGDEIVIVDMSTLSSISHMQRMRKALVSGIYKSGLQEYDQTVVYMPLEDVQKFFQYGNDVSGYVINLTDDKSADDLASLIEAGLGYPHFAMTWKEKHATLFNWLHVQKWPILIIFGMIALVGVVNIISSMTMIVMEKIRTIGTLKAMGMNNRTIKRIFLIKGLFIGILGSLGGVFTALVLGMIQIKFKPISIAEDIYFMSHVPVQFDWVMVGWILILSLSCSLMASFYPTKKASVIDPAIALRYE